MKNDSAHRVLIVDDNRAIHEDFGKILTRSGVENDLALAEAAFLGDEFQTETVVQYDLDHAFQGKEGLQMLKDAIAEGRPYDMAFVDMRMPPGWDGVETIEKLWGVDPELQVVICTAYSDYTWGEIAKRLGLNDRLLILKKPFDNVEVSQLAAALTAKRCKERAQFVHQEELEQALENCTCKEESPLLASVTLS